MSSTNKIKKFGNRNTITIVSVIICLILGGIGLAKYNHSSQVKQSLMLANKYSEEGNSKGAILEFQKVISLDARKAEAYLGLANVYMSQNSPKDAIKTLTDGYVATNDDSIKNTMEDIKSRLMVADINETIVLGEDYELPKKATVLINDKPSEYPVKWEVVEVDTGKSGIQSFKGTLENTDKEIMLNLNILSILSIDDINNTITQNDSYALPSKVKAKMSDDTVSELVVSWTPEKVDTSKIGNYDFVGSVNGYKEKVKLKLKIEKLYTKGEEIQVYKNILNDKKWLNNNGIPKYPQAGMIYEHHFIDLDQDGVNEMIVYHGGSRDDSTVSVFTYNKGDFKVQHLDAGQSEYGGYNKSKKTFFIDGMARGFYWTSGYKLVNGRCEEVFRAKCELDAPEEFQTFELNGKKVSKSEYNKFLASYGKNIYN